MAKDGHSSSLSPFQRFEKLAKALFAIPKKEAQGNAPDIRRKCAKRARSPKTG